MTSIAQLLEDRILNYLVDQFVDTRHKFFVNGRRFRLATLEEAPGIDDDAIVLIEPDTGELYEVEIYGVDVRKVEGAP